MPTPQGLDRRGSSELATYGGTGAHTPGLVKQLGFSGWNLPPWVPQWLPRQHWLERRWNPGVGASAAATAYGWPYEDVTIRLVPPFNTAAAMMARGSLAALGRPGGGGLDWAGTTRIPATPVPINYSRTGY